MFIGDDVKMITKRSLRKKWLFLTIDGEPLSFMKGLLLLEGIDKIKIRISQNNLFGPNEGEIFGKGLEERFEGGEIVFFPM